MIKVKRIYEKAEKNDGLRVLVDRLWPKGVKKRELVYDLWLKEAAPSGDLRRWFNHETEKWPVFKKEYFAELDRKEAVLAPVLGSKKKNITLLFSAKDERHNQAVALKEFLEKKK